MSSLDDAMRKHIEYIVLKENRPFSYVDFLSFTVDEVQYSMTHRTFLNKIWKLKKEGLIQVAYYSSLAFYTLKDANFTRTVTGHPTGVQSISSLADISSCQLYKHHIVEHPVCNLVKDLRFGETSFHDIHLTFRVKGIWSVLSLQYNPNPKSKDIQLRPWPWRVEGLDIKVTIYSTDTVGVDIGCSYCPVVADVSGVSRLSNALHIVRERISNIITYAGKPSSNRIAASDIPNPMLWIVTLWHHGADALVSYTGEKFYVTIYSKRWNDGKSRLRVEKQEYPRKPLEDALEEKSILNGGRLD